MTFLETVNTTKGLLWIAGILLSVTVFFLTLHSSVGAAQDDIDDNEQDIQRIEETFVSMQTLLSNNNTNILLLQQEMKYLRAAADKTNEHLEKLRGTE